MPPRRPTRRGWNVREQGSVISRESWQKELEGLLEQEGQMMKCQEKLKISERLSKEEQSKAIEEAIEVLYGYHPQPAQTDALRWLRFERKDMLLVARTSLSAPVLGPRLYSYHHPAPARHWFRTA